MTACVKMRLNRTAGKRIKGMWKAGDWRMEKVGPALQLSPAGANCGRAGSCVPPLVSPSGSPSASCILMSSCWSCSLALLTAGSFSLFSQLHCYFFSEANTSQFLHLYFSQPLSLTLSTTILLDHLFTVYCVLLLPTRMCKWRNFIPRSFWVIVNS